MQRDWIIALAAGLVSGLLFLSVLSGNMLSLMLIYLAPLPLVIAALGWGPTVGNLAAIVGTVMLVLSFNLAGAGLFALLYAGPPVFLSRLALRRYPLAAAPGGGAFETFENPQDTGPDTVAWYPTGHLVTWIAAIAVGLFLLIHVIFAGPYGGLVPLIEEQLTKVIQDPEAILAQLEDAGTTMSQEELFGFIARMIPGIVGVFWFAVMILNLALAQAVVKVSGRAWRPDFDWVRMDLPFGMALALAAAMLVSFMPGGIGFIGSTASVILAAPYFLTGLITAHRVSAHWAETSDMPAVTASLRLTGLAALYLTLLMLQGAAAQLISLLGILDQWFGLRRRYAPDFAAPADREE